MSVLLPQENMILTPPPPDGECGAGVDVPAALQAVLPGTPPSNRQTGLPPESELQAPTPPDYLRSVWNSKFDPSEPSDDSNPSVTDGSSLPSVPSPSTMDRDTEFDGPQPQRFATLEQMGSGVQQACGDADTFDHKAVSHGRVEEACLGGRMGPMAHHPPAAGGAGAASADAPPKTPPQTPPRKRNKPGCGSGGMGSGEPSTGAGSGVGIDAFSGSSGGRGSSGGDGGGSGGGGPH
uniref:Uncharacterized protein n=1 Tax=Haptolina ericina TaxID=156174 RepID=A0A7S3B611_9EUKA